MSENLASQTVLVTGATGGIGPAIVDRLLKRQAGVIGTYHNPEELEKAKERYPSLSKADLFRVDLTDPEQLRELAEKLNDRQITLNSIVNLVGGFSGGGLKRTEKESLVGSFRTQVITVFLVIKQFLPQIEQSGGAIVNFSSQRALNNEKGSVAYNISKTALVSLSKSVNNEMERGRINVLAPSVMDTPANREYMPDADFDKWAGPQQVADVVEFLVSEKSSRIKGEVIRI